MIEIKSARTECCSEVKFIQVWEACSHTNEFGAKGPVIGYFSEFHHADAAIDGKGWYGGRGSVNSADAVVINGKVYLLAREEPIDLDQQNKMRDDELRRTTLASLTPEQKRVLGL